MSETVAPLERTERINSLDVLRGVALLGILLMNIVAMGLPHWAYDDPTVAGNQSPIDFWTWAVNSVLFEGKMRTIFSMLFGAGVILITSRVEQRGGRDTPADIHLRRNMWLILFGALHGYLLLWPGDILYLYGLAGVFLFVFRRVRPMNLIILGAIILALQAPKMYGHMRDLAGTQQRLAELNARASAGAVLTAEEESTRKTLQEKLEEETATAAGVQKEIDARRGGYVSNISLLAPVVFQMETTIAYIVLFWDAIGMMLLGMALFKLGVFSASRTYTFYAVMALCGYAYGLPVGIFVVWDWMQHGFALGTRWVTLYDTTRFAVALGHVAVVMMVCKAGLLNWITRPLAAVGQMALTNYIMHSVITMFVFTGIGFGLFARLARHELYYVVAGIWAFQLIASPVWLRYFRFGPLEWLWRSLTYKQRQPMRIRADTGAPATVL